MLIKKLNLLLIIFVFISNVNVYASKQFSVSALFETPQVKINGNELRVDGKKKDELQTVMQMIKDSNVGIPVQFVNFRD